MESQAAADLVPVARSVLERERARPAPLSRGARLILAGASSLANFPARPGDG